MPNWKIVLCVLLGFTTVLTACGAPAAPAPGAQGAPAATGAAMTPQKGGEITVAYKDDLATLDPAIGYDWTNWPVIKMVFDGLLDYDESTNVTPRIAESLPEIS